MSKVRVVPKEEVQQQRATAERKIHAKRSKLVDAMLTLMQEYPDKAEQFIKEGKHRAEDMAVGV